ncbi:hypothetical protein [Martelella limonii]|uniref:hypothetical protein n=1 Tax=Martelella limonii TaxID=1647649 RepID=UPI00157FDE55|nr:hypothetical protein [Martelella limonii]
MPNFKTALCLVPILFLAACTDSSFDSLSDSDYDTGGSSSGGGTPKSSILQCPSSCTTTSGAPVNIQVATHCDAARSYYSEYKLAVQQYGTAGAEPYWNAYEQTADLANEMYSTFSCKADY